MLKTCVQLLYHKDRKDPKRIELTGRIGIYIVIMHVIVQTGDVV